MHTLLGAFNFRTPLLSTFAVDRFFFDKEGRQYHDTLIFKRCDLMVVSKPYPFLRILIHVLNMEGHLEVHLLKYSYDFHKSTKL
jgi:hypothetical protein